MHSQVLSRISCLALTTNPLLSNPSVMASTSFPLPGSALMWDPLNMHLGIWTLRFEDMLWKLTSGIFHHFPMIFPWFPMSFFTFISFSPKRIFQNHLQSHLFAKPSPSLRPGPDVFRSFSSTPDVAGASLWVGLSGHGDVATESPGWTSQCLEERPGDGCMAAVILVGWYS